MIDYRKADVDDISELARMRLEFLSEVQALESVAGEDQLYLNLKDYFAENMRADRFMAWLAIDNGVIVGISGIYFYNLPPSYKKPNGKVAYIMNMYTKPDYRGKGIASVLFAKLVDESKQRGCEKISLNATDMGRPLYMKFGFKESGDTLILNLL